MNKLKLSMALMALMIPLLLCAKRSSISLEYSKHKSIVESLIPVEASFDDESKELTLEFSQDWEPIIIEIKSKEGHVVYRDSYMPFANSSFSSTLENIPTGIYELTISDERMMLIGEFILKN